MVSDRIGQEALTKIAGHSGATAVRVGLKEKAGWIELMMESSVRGVCDRACGVRLKAKVSARRHPGAEGAMGDGRILRGLGWGIT